MTPAKVILIEPFHGASLVFVEAGTNDRSELHGGPEDGGRFERLRFLA
jgi:hypothetical protein